jgi:hypothetical protein
MTAHTPATLAALLAGTTEGPWAYEPHGDTGEYGVGLCFADDDFDCKTPLTGEVDSSATVSDPVAVEVNGAPNARLIAAAPTLATELSAALVREAELREALGVALPLLQDHARWLRDLQAHATVIERTRCAIEQVSAALATKPEERG